MKNKILIIISICIFTSFYVKADNKEWKSGYIITNNNDTIHGQLAYRDGVDDWKNCLFRKSHTDSIEVYTPLEVKVLFYNVGIRFESINLDVPPIKGTFFVECLLKGDMSLYYLKMNNNKEFDSYYAVNKTTGITRSFSQIEEYTDYYANNKIKTRLKAIFNFNPEINKEISNRTLNRDNIIEIFKKYNNLSCNNQNRVLYQEKKRKKSKYLSIYTGAIGTLFKDECESSTNTYLSPELGAKLYISTSKLSERVFLCLGLKGYAYLTNDQDETINILAYSLGTEYRLMHKKLKPSFEIGAILNTYNSILNSKKIEPGFLAYFGIYANLGINIPYRKSEIPIRISYSQDAVQGSIKNLELSIGYKFKLGK